MTDQEIAERIKSSVNISLSPREIIRLTWAFTTDPELMAEIIHRHKSWLDQQEKSF